MVDSPLAGGSVMATIIRQNSRNSLLAGGGDEPDRLRQVLLF